MAFSPQSATTIERGYPHLAVVHRSLTALHKAVPDIRTTFAQPIAGREATLPADKDLVIAVQYVARALIRHLELPEAQVIVAFQRMTEAGRVELGQGPAYFVDVNEDYRSVFKQPDIPAVLAHEVTHVLLHRHRLRFPLPDENELLTDTAAVYLGVGWLLLNAYRKTEYRNGGVLHRSEDKLGYLTPEEFGYVLAKRSLAWGEDPAVTERTLTDQARDLYRSGLRRARDEQRHPPLAAASRLNRRRYGQRRQDALRAAADPTRFRTVTTRFADYSFELDDPVKVVFSCPTCHHKLRLPVGRKVKARCTVCRTVLPCET